MGNVLLAPNPKYANCNDTRGSSNAINRPGVHTSVAGTPAGRIS